MKKITYKNNFKFSAFDENQGLVTRSDEYIQGIGNPWKVSKGATFHDGNKGFICADHGEDAISEVDGYIVYETIGSPSNVPRCRIVPTIKDVELFYRTRGKI